MEPSSLRDLCVDKVSLQPSPFYAQLPWMLKNKLLHKLTRRGKCNDEVLSWLLHSHLIELDVRECVISGQTLKNLSRAKNLRELFLPEPPLVERSHFSESSLLRVGEGNPHLRVVSLNGLCGVTDRVVMALVGSCVWLQELHISATPITDHALAALATLTHLASLNIAKTQVSDVGIQQLVCGGVGNSLRELRIDGCARLTDYSIESLCHYCTHLSILCFHHCPRLSERSQTLAVQLKSQSVKQLTWTIY